MYKDINDFKKKNFLVKQVKNFTLNFGPQHPAAVRIYLIYEGLKL